MTTHFTHHLIKNGAVINDEWLLIHQQDGNPPLVIADAPILVSLPVWETCRNQLETHLGIGIWLEPDNRLESIIPDLPRFAVIAINFPRFSDGRPYSLAYTLRRRHQFKGELRAVGDVLHDQLFYMSQVGFDAFALRSDQNPDFALESAFASFSGTYQRG